MADMLVRLYNLPNASPVVEKLEAEGIGIRRAKTGEMSLIHAWVSRHFAESWANGCQKAILRTPISCFIAVQNDTPPTQAATPYEGVPSQKLVGFACYDGSGKGTFGSMGVHPDFQRKGVGRELTLRAMHAMREEGYVYAIVGWAGNPDFYAATVGATLIEDSEPSIFGNRLSEYN